MIRVRKALTYTTFRFHLCPDALRLLPKISHSAHDTTCYPTWRAACRTRLLHFLSLHSAIRLAVCFPYHILRLMVHLVRADISSDMGTDQPTCQRLSDMRPEPLPGKTRFPLLFPCFNCGHTLPPYTGSLAAETKKKRFEVEYSVYGKPSPSQNFLRRQHYEPSKVHDWTEPTTHGNAPVQPFQNKCGCSPTLVFACGPIVVRRSKKGVWTPRVCILLCSPSALPTLFVSSDNFRVGAAFW